MTKNLPQVIQIDSYRFLTYLPHKQRIEITCEAYKHSQQKTDIYQGMFIVTLPEGCVCKTAGFRFLSVGNLGTYHSFIGVNNNLDLADQLKYINRNNMEKILKNFDAEEEKVVKVDKIVSAYQLDQKWLKNMPHEFLYSMGSMGSLGVLAVFIAVLAIWKPWKKKRKDRVVVKERTNVVYKKSDHGIQVEKPVYRISSKESLSSI